MYDLDEIPLEIKHLKKLHYKYLEKVRLVALKMFYHRVRFWLDEYNFTLVTTLGADLQPIGGWTITYKNGIPVDLLALALYCPKDIHETIHMNVPGTNQPLIAWMPTYSKRS
jgi:hypothetical protein